MASLPKPPAAIVAPRFFAPSSWSLIERCPMAVWAQASAVLPEPVEVIVGRLFHSIRDEVLKRQLLGPDHADDVRNIIGVAKGEE